MHKSIIEIKELLTKNKDAAKAGHFKMIILRNVTVEAIELFLKYFSFEIGYEAQIKFGEYDNVVQETVFGDKSLLNDQVDCVLVFLKLEILSPLLMKNFSGLNRDQILEEIQRLQAQIKDILEGIRKQTNAMILWQGFEYPLYPAYGIADSKVGKGQSAAIHDLNEFTRHQLSQTDNAHFVDLNLILMRLGAANFYDNRYWHIGRSPYSRDALYEIAGENFKYLRAIKGKNKKCLVLDCDNVLWGGIIGEDGLAGIKLGTSYPGSMFYEFQQEVLNLVNRGVIVALCSKNNEKDVWEVFEKHPDMVIKKEHIATAEINWNDKASGLKKIASDLNIGLDSLVFLDDNIFEINLVKQYCPQVMAVHIPPENAVENRNILASLGVFDTLIISDEDKKRNSMYRAENERKKVQAGSSDLATYLKTLEMVVEIKSADDFSIPRIAQLTQKTNQFNLTTFRYSDADIKQLTQSDSSSVLYLKLSDKFGDSGMVGACILKYTGSDAVIDTFLLSCRVLGRGIEQIFLNHVLKLAQKKKMNRVLGNYIPTSKNSQVKDFYSQQGFQTINDPLNTSKVEFIRDLAAGIQPDPDHFKVIDSDI